MALQQKQKEKLARRLELKELKAASPRKSGDEDPDIAGIRPGPQPPAPQLQDLEDLERGGTEPEDKV